MQYYQIEKLVNVLHSIQDQPVQDIQNSIFILEYIDTILPIEKRRLLLANKLIEQYGTKNDSGDFEVKPTNESYFEFIKKYNELQATNVDIPSIPIDVFKSFSLSLNQLKILKDCFNY